MEEELRCFHCHSFYHVPVLLSCAHALCLSCAINLQKQEGVDGCYSETNGSGTKEVSEADKVSDLSDADSGVSCSSRTASIFGGSEGGCTKSSDNGELTPSVYTIKCPQCNAETSMDETGAKGLQRYRVLAAVVDKYLERFQVTEACQLCHDVSSKPAQMFCDQCLIFYCISCKENCHPSWGPLADHWFVSVAEGRSLLRARRREIEGKCVHHSSENVSMYCSTCCMPVCLLCLHDGRHQAHNVHSLNAISKSLKTELSQSLQQLSERAREATGFMHTLKTFSDDLQGSCRESEGALVAQIDALMDALQGRRTFLINWIRSHRDAKIRILREQTQEYTRTLQSTTATIQFCIEALKESDPASFMEVHEVLKDRIESKTYSFDQSMPLEARIDDSFEFSLNDKSLLSAINQLTFLQLDIAPSRSDSKKHSVPASPSFLTNECSAVNNCVTLSWERDKISSVTGFLLEIDDGEKGQFKEVYNGEETLCTIDGLHFNSLYRARIRAFNGAGISPHSEILCLQTAQVAYFTLEATHSDLILAEGDTTISCDSFEHRVSLGSLGFSRGTHYWQFLVEKYDGNADIAVGIALEDVDTEKLLGHCKHGWGMYIDNERSWLVEEGNHVTRRSGGVATKDTIGVLLSFSPLTLTMYVNKVCQGYLLVNGVNGVIFPAVSLNRSVTLRLQTELPLPEDYLLRTQPETEL